MVSGDRVAEILGSAVTLGEAADRLIDDANEAGGRDNITVVLSRIGEGDGEPATDQPTIVGGPTAARGRQARGSAVALAPSPSATGNKLSPGRERTPTRRSRRLTKPGAALVGIGTVLFLVGGGGLLA